MKYVRLITLSPISVYYIKAFNMYKWLLSWFKGNVQRSAFQLLENIALIEEAIAKFNMW